MQLPPIANLSDDEFEPVLLELLTLWEVGPGAKLPGDAVERALVAELRTRLAIRIEQQEAPRDDLAA